MATQSELQLRITETETALHTLVTGGGVVEIDDPVMGRVRYAERDISKLQAYLQSLQTQLSQTVAGVRRRPIYFSF